jgi:flagellar hook-associated protein 3 FlgL
LQFQTIGDLAAHLTLRGHNARVSGNVDRLSNEVASGRLSDLAGSVRGNFRPLAQIDRDLTLVNRHVTVAAEAALRADAEETTLDRVHAALDTTLSVVITAGDTPTEHMLAAAERQASAAFGDIVSALNGRAVGQSLFAGIATDSPALTDAAAMLDTLATAVAGETGAAGLHAAVDAWFDDPGGGYETEGYLGSATVRAPLAIGEDVVLAAGPTALDPAIRAVLAPLATLALADAQTPALSIDERTALVDLVRADLLNAGGRLTALRGDTGARQATIDSQQSALAAERGALEIARSAITDADPYQAAIELEAATAQLEILYTITGRLSQLSLVNFLR